MAKTKEKVVIDAVAKDAEAPAPLTTEQVLAEKQACLTQINPILTEKLEPILKKYGCVLGIGPMNVATGTLFASLNFNFTLLHKSEVQGYPPQA